MAQQRMKSLTAALALAAAVTSAQYAVARPLYSTQDVNGRPVNVYGRTCYKWFDTDETMRCFDCLKKVRTPMGWQWANTCPPRYVNDF
jgi:hypothetical protein